MAFFPFNRKQTKRAPKASSNLEASDGKSQLTLQLEEVKRQRQELLRRTEEAQRKVEDIPKKIEERKRREVERIHERAQNHKTVRGLVKPTYRIPSVVTRKHSRAEQRSMAKKFLILCAVLAVLLFFLWKAAS
ncbi:MAG: hypothetical protein ORN23_09610 [Chthoniobacterales bacterium]|nr:hypothetical protein [Chthoniobacterales bacterium]